MKKKGFTLVELLGVIIILAVIALIAVPTILGVIENAKKNSLKNSAYGLIEAANLYYAENVNSKTIRFDIENNKIETAADNKLDYKGNIKNGTVLINKLGQVVVCVNDGNYAAYKNYNDDKVTIVDKKTCTIPETTYIVYLDDETTIPEMSNSELTDNINKLLAAVEELKTDRDSLEQENETLKNRVTSLGEKETLSVDEIYPVGSIYISINSEDPSTLFEGTTWEKYGIGNTLLSTDGQSNETGGNSKITLTTNNLPNHSHTYLKTNDASGTTALTAEQTPGTILRSFNNTTDAWSFGTWANYGTGYVFTMRDQTGYGTYGLGHTHTLGTISTATESTGTGSSFNIQNPYITVYMWKRTK